MRSQVYMEPSPALVEACAGALGGVVGLASTYPLLTVSTRLQVARRADQVPAAPANQECSSSEGKVCRPMHKPATLRHMVGPALPNRSASNQHAASPLPACTRHAPGKIGVVCVDVCALCRVPAALPGRGADGNASHVTEAS